MSLASTDSQAGSLIRSINQMITDNSDLSVDFGKATTHIQIEKWLNSQYHSHKLKGSKLKITLISKGSGGFGDVIWGVRAIKALLDTFPNAQISIISDALDKFQQVNATEGISGGIELIEHNDKEKVSENLDSCNVAIDGPYPNGRSQLFGWDFEPVKRLIKSRRLITGIEYDRGDYDSKWWKEKKPSTFISGIGDNTYGIFIIEELRDFVGSSKLPLSSSEKTELVERLKDPAIKSLIQNTTSKGNYPLYFGYGYQRQKEFVEIITRYEATHDKDDNVVIMLLSGGGSVFDEKGLLESLQANPPSNIASISTLSPKYRYSDEELHQFADNYSHLGVTFESLKERQSDIPEGHDYMIQERELIKLANHGRKIYIIKPGKGVAKNDMMIMHKISESISMLTGDQSLSEGISMGKMLLYDPRKIESLQWLIRLAKRNNLNLIAEYFDAFTFKKDVSKIIELLNNPNLKEEKDRLFEICRKRNLAESLQQMVSRRVFNIKTEFKTEELENEIHQWFDTSQDDESERLESLMNQLSKTILNTNLNT